MSKTLAQIQKNEESKSNSKHIFIQLGGEFFINQVKMSIESDLFERTLYYQNFRNIFIEAEIDRENTYFYELGIGYNTLGELYKVKDLPFAIGNDDTFNSIKIYGGFGKKIMLKNNLNLFNLQFGGSLGINLTSSGLSNLIDTYQVKNENGQSAIIKAYSSGTVAKIFPTVYVALSKDIRVTNNFYFCLTYRYDQGFVTTYQQKFEYFYINSSSDVKTVNNNITGTSHSLQFGFKYKFLPKKYK